MAGYSVNGSSELIKPAAENTIRFFSMGLRKTMRSLLFFSVFDLETPSRI
jgi:hypothetical protein